MDTTCTDHRPQAGTIEIQGSGGVSFSVPSSDILRCPNCGQYERVSAPNEVAYVFVGGEQDGRTFPHEPDCRLRHMVPGLNGTAEYIHADGDTLALKVPAA